MSLGPLQVPGYDREMLQGRVGIVTGGSKGIGAATALALSQVGAKVVIAARGKDDLDRASRVIVEAGGDSLSVPTNVADPGSVERLIDLTLEKYGRLDFAFNNAGSGHSPAPLAEIGVEDFDRSLSANVRGTYLCMKYEIPAMLKTGGGSIVNMSSTAGLQGVSGLAGYVTGKHAVIGLTRAAAMDYARRNVRVNAVAPGPILTGRSAGPMSADQAAFAVPLGRVGQSTEVAAVVLWLCSDYASFVTGTVISVDGGRMAGVSFTRPGP